MKEFGLIKGQIAGMRKTLNNLKWEDAKFDTYFLRNKQEMQNHLIDLEELLKRAKGNYEGS